MSDTTRTQGLIRMTLMGIGFIGLTVVLVVFQPGSPRKASNSDAFESHVTRVASPPENVRSTETTHATPAPAYSAPQSTEKTSAELDQTGSIRDLTFIAISNLKSATTGEAPAPGEPGSLLHSVVQRSIASSTPEKTAASALEVATALAEPIRPVPARMPRAKTYFVRPGDTLVSIARELYGDVNMASALFMQNTEVISRPDSLRPGMILSLPSQ